MNNMVQWAMQMLQANGVKEENEDTKRMVNAIRTGDEKAGVAIADDILRKAGVSRDQGIQIAMQRFRIPGGK